MENNNKSAPKVIKNPLLQSSNYGFPFDSLRTNSLVVPVSRESSSSLTGNVLAMNFFCPF